MILYELLYVNLLGISCRKTALLLDYWTIVEHQNPTSTCFARESTKSSPADLWAGRVFCKAACGGSLTMGLTKNVIAIIWYYTYIIIIIVIIIIYTHTLGVLVYTH